jgi:quercetin dioxygenase-like cupin family protein
MFEGGGQLSAAQQALWTTCATAQHWPSPGEPDARRRSRVLRRYDARVESWHLPSVEQSGRREPRVLFSAPECRAVVIDLRAGEELGEHEVRERAVLHVVAGRVAITDGGGAGETIESGTLVTFAPHERHAVRAEEDARLLLLLAPWPAPDHYPPEQTADPTRTPSRGTA